MRGVQLPGYQLETHQIADTFQSSVQRAEDGKGLSQASTPSYVAEVLAVYSEKMACDLKTWNGSTAYAVPIRTKGGLVNDEVYGELELPEIGDFVFVEFLGGKENAPIITGTILPFFHKKFQDSQTPVNSGNKAFTKKLLEKSKPKTYRKIFRSGATIEVQENGSFIIETPSGSFFQIDEANKKIIVSLKDGSVKGKIEMTSASTKINDNLEVLL